MDIGAGIILFRKRKETNETEFFVVNPWNPYKKHFWNFPKGLIDEKDENPFQTAIREFFEETGTKVSDNENKYVYHGLIKQRPNKSVHVFSKPWEKEDLSNCSSNEFLGEDGKMHPEIGEWSWKTLDEIKSEGGVKSYYNLFETLCIN